MTSSEQSGWVRVAVALRVERAVDFPIHVMRRIAALVGDQEIVYAEHTVEVDGGKASGEVVVVTPTTVVRAVLQDSRGLMDEPDKHVSSVACSSWARRDLIGVEIGASDEGVPNDDYGWHHDWSADWPPNGAISLTYGHGQELTLPLRPSEWEKGPRPLGNLIAMLLPTLVEDLSH